MDDDAAPRLAPPPKPTALELSTHKPVVPEVSLMFDSDDSLIWQASKRGIQNGKESPFGNHLRQDKGQFSNQNISTNVKSPPMFDVVDARRKNNNTNSSPKNLQIKSVHFESSSTYAQSNVMANVASERMLKNSQAYHPKCVSTPPHNSLSITSSVNEKPYNPKVYSPAQKIPTNIVLYDLGSHVLKQKDSPLTGNSTSVEQIHTASVADTLRPSQPQLDQNVNQYIFRSGSVIPPLITNVPVQEKFSYPVITELSMTKKNSNVLQNTNNRENINPSHAAVYQSRLSTNSQGQAQEKMRNVHQDHFSQISTSLPLQTAQTNHVFQDKRYSVPINEGWAHAGSPNCSPHSVGHMFYSPTDPMVYRLIEDQSQQILKLTKALENVMEKQHGIESLRDARTNEVPNNKGLYVNKTNSTQESSHKEISTQTSASVILETRSVGVNTDLSWSELVDSIRNSDACVSPSETGPDYSRRPKCSKAVQSNNASRNRSKENRDASKHQSRQKINSAGINSVLLNNGSESSEPGDDSSDDGDPSSRQAVPVNVSKYHTRSVSEENDYLRNGKRSVKCVDSLALGESASSYNKLQGQDQSPGPLYCPQTATFYNNVMTNIKQILQSSKRTEKEEMEQEWTNDDVVQTSVPLEANGGTVEMLPDAQIEAVRKQLMQFGISFIDPVSLTSNHRTIMDTMYLPGLHNMLSVYQSTMSTHYQTPYHETDATAAKYLTDSQLAAIAAMSPAMTKRNRGDGTSMSVDCPVPPRIIDSQEKNQNQLHKVSMNNDFSIATKKFLDRYGLQEN
ncbi:SCL-interrupting locus protein homolog [Procambarus clarkii]|uniref:SCL-interrupting locus protein homolog n=1 Tax=Procambarus clarkii TaxID=6728 RepID=UPI003742E4AB